MESVLAYFDIPIPFLNQEPYKSNNCHDLEVALNEQKMKKIIDSSKLAKDLAAGEPCHLIVKIED